MEKVICSKCGSTGYTASPDAVVCSECGGRHQVVRTRVRIRKSMNNKLFRLIRLSLLL